MLRLIGFLIIIFSAISPVWAQSETDLKQSFEGRTVTLRIDLPATKAGVNIYPERSQPFDYREYENRIKRHGAFVRGFEVVTITTLKVKGKHIEVQFAGHGTPHGVARFNIHFSRIESWMLTPVALLDALGRYVEFQTDVVSSFRQSGGAVRHGVVKFGPRSTYLKEGLQTREVLVFRI